MKLYGAPLPPSPYVAGFVSVTVSIFKEQMKLWLVNSNVAEQFPGFLFSQIFINQLCAHLFCDSHPVAGTQAGTCD